MRHHTTANIDTHRLRIEVSDTGIGLGDSTSIDGNGLANVRARLTTLYGEVGKLSLENNIAAGATASLELPR